MSRFAIPGRIRRATHGETGLLPGNPSFGEGVRETLTPVVGAAFLRGSQTVARRGDSHGC